MVGTRISPDVRREHVRKEGAIHQILISHAWGVDVAARPCAFAGLVLLGCFPLGFNVTVQDFSIAPFLEQH